MAGIGTGTTVTFGTSGFSAELLGIDHGDIARPKIDTTHYGSTGRTARPGKLVDPGEVELELAFDPADRPPVSADPEVITIQMPPEAGEITGAKLEGTGFISGWKFGLPLEERNTGSATVVWSGAPTWTDPT